MAHEIFVGVGANLTSPCYGPPLDTCRWAICQLVSISGLRIRSISSFYRSAAIPASAQPDYINAVVELSTTEPPAPLLRELHRIEAQAGRVRSLANAARVLDLDLLAVDGVIMAAPDLVLPHPRLAERAFVLYPLCDIAPGWAHPLLGLTAAELRDRLPPQRIERLADSTRDLLLRARVLS